MACTNKILQKETYKINYLQARFKKAIVHIGLGKTGTSALQIFLSRNIEAFEKHHGIIYPFIIDDPRPFRENHSIFLSSLFMLEAYKTPVNISHGFDTPEKLETINIKTKNALDHLFNQSNADTLLISAEGISTMKKNAFERFVEWIKTYAEEIEIIACVRHPYDGISSEIQQQLKNGKILEDIYKRPQVKGASKCMRKILLHFQKEQIKSYDFVKATSHPNGIIGKFLETINIPLENLDFSSGKGSNTSMSLEACLLLNSLNKLRPKYQDGKMGKARFSKDLRFFLDLPGNKFTIPTTLFEKLSEQIAEEELWLQQHINLSLNKRSTKQIGMFNLSGEAIDAIANFTQLDGEWIRSQFTKEWNLQSGLDVQASMLHEVALAVSDKLNQEELNRLNSKKNLIGNAVQSQSIQKEIDRIS